MTRIAPVLLGLLVLSSPALAAVITVDDDGPADYSTIQDAVDNALAGDTISVAAGTYAEEVTVPLSVTITGAGIGSTLVVPATSRTVMIPFEQRRAGRMVASVVTRMFPRTRSSSNRPRTSPHLGRSCAPSVTRTTRTASA